MSFRSLLFGTKVRVAAMTLLVLASSVGGAYTLGAIGAPSVTGVDNEFGPVDGNETVVYTDLVVENPNPVGASLNGLSVDYTVSMNDVRVASGEKEGVSVGADRSRLPFETTMRNDRIPAWWVTHVRNGESSKVVVDAAIHSSLLDRSTTIPQQQTVETDIIGQFRSTEDRPVDADHPLVSDPVLIVRETDARWGNVTNETTPIEMEFVVYNPKATPYVITEVGYEITMNEVDVGNGSTEREYVIPGEEQRTVRAETAIDNGRLDEWWVSHLERNQTTDLQIDFYAKVRLSEGETVRVPMDELTYNRTIETDIFGNENASGNASGSNETATPTATATADGGSDDGTATATPTETATSTPANTTTEDDELSAVDGRDAPPYRLRDGSTTRPGGV
jgi:LEA14-like dessication related protein